MTHPFTLAEFKSYMKVLRVMDVPKELKNLDIVILHCIFDALWLERLDAISVLYDHVASRPMTFMFDEICKHLDPIHVAVLRKDRKPVLVLHQDLYSLVDLVLVNSRFQQSNLKEYLDVQSRVVNPPVTEHFKPCKNPTRDYFLSVQRVNWQKRISLQIEAFRGLKQKLKIVGSPRMGIVDQQLRYLTQDMPNVKVLPRVPDKMLVKLYQNARATIQTGHKEDFGLVPIEGFACGTPAIVVDEGGFKETVHSNEFGIRVKQPYCPGLKHAIRHFDDSSYDAKTLRHESERYSLARFNRQMAECFEEATIIHNARRRKIKCSVTP